MYTASWDKMIRVIDIKEGLTLKSYTGSQELIKDVLIITDRGEKNEVIVAGCENSFRGFNVETGVMRVFQGHLGWVYCLYYFDGKLFSGGDDFAVRIWDLETGL